jgi:hypothetical protein
MSDASPAPPTQPEAPPQQPAAPKPAILRSSEFTVEEGLGYRLCRTGAIWMNKLFFSSLVLLVVWLALAAATHETGCVGSIRTEDQNGTLVDSGTALKCSTFLTPTAKYLGAMAVLSFLASLAFGALGLVVGKRILEVSASQDELGAGARPEPSEPADPSGPGPGRP